MGAHLRGKKKTKTYYVLATPYIYYGWKTYDLGTNEGITEKSLIKDLGLVKGDSLQPDATKIYILNANSPKPIRLTKRLEKKTSDGSDSITTFCAYDKVTSAMTRGWTIASDSRSVPILSQNGPKKLMTAFVPLAGGFYSFPISKWVYSTHGEALGLELPGANANSWEKAFAGTSNPKPGRARLTTPTGTVSTF